MSTLMINIVTVTVVAPFVLLGVLCLMECFTPDPEDDQPIELQAGHGYDTRDLH